MDDKFYEKTSKYDVDIPETEESEYSNYDENYDDDRYEDYDPEYADLYPEFIDIPREKKHRKKKHLFLRFIIIVIIIGGLVGFAMTPFFNSKKVEVKGNSYYTAEEIISMAKVKTGGNIFRSTHPSKIKSNLKDNPYFESVHVYYKLPSTIVIKVKEKTQAAALSYGDKYIVIDSDGLILRETDVDPEVTIIKGLTLKNMEVGTTVEVEQSSMLTSTMELLKSVEEGDFYFKEVDVSSVLVTAYINDYFIVKGKPSVLKDSIDNGQLQKVVSNLYEKKIKRGTLTVSEDDYISFSPDF